MKLLGITKCKITTDENAVNVPPSFTNYWISISPSQYCQQWLSARFKKFMYIYS